MLRSRRVVQLRLAALHLVQRKTQLFDKRNIGTKTQHDQPLTLQQKPQLSTSVKTGKSRLSFNCMDSLL